MFATFIRALLGAFGIIKKTKKFTAEHNEEFMQALAPCAVICTSLREANFIQGGIQGATNSFWGHTLLYVGKTAGEMIRGMFPELTKNPLIGEEAKTHETIEALAEGIRVSTLDKNLGDNVQMVGYICPVTADEMVKILLRAYRDVGKPYDYSEFIGDAFPTLPIPNPEDLNCCASGVTKWWLAVKRIVSKKVDERKATPADVNNFLHSNLKCEQTRYNW